MPSEYDHSEKAGNAGDVWKHFILLTVASHIANMSSFTYVETHSGLGRYRLGNDGQWHSGIARIIKPSYRPTHPYFLIAQEYLYPSHIYLSSWSLLLKHLGDIPALSCSFHLFDTSDAVAAWFRDNLSDDVFFKQEDGFNGIRSITDRPNLVLVDPPYSPDAVSDWKQVASAVQFLLEFKIPFLAWYPVLSSDNPQDLIDTTGCFAYEVLWSKTGLRGCGMLVSPECLKVIHKNSDNLTLLAKALHGVFFIRRPQHSCLQSYFKET